MVAKRETAPEIDGLTATKVSTYLSLDQTFQQAWQYHHASDYRPDGKKICVFVNLDTGKTSVWRMGDDASAIRLQDPSDAEISAAVRGLSYGFVLDMSTDVESLPARTAARRLIDAGFEYSDYLGRYAWTSTDGRYITALLALDTDGSQIIDDHDDPVTYPGLNGAVAVVNAWHLNDAFPLVGHETLAPTLEDAIEVARRGLLGRPNIAEHGWDEAEIDSIDAAACETNEGMLAHEALMNRVDRIGYKQIDFDYAELVAGNPKP